MINPKELRIGINGFTPFDHSIRCDETEGCILLIDIYHELTGKWKIGREADSPECEPIPITPEWLERCGFKEEQRERLGRSWEISIMPSAKRVLGVCNMTSRTLVSFVAEPGNIVMLRPIYYIHQLQNLYFALTVEELEIKL